MRGKIAARIGVPLLFLISSALGLWGQNYKLAVYFNGPTGMIREVERAFESYRGDVLEITTLFPRIETELSGGGTEADIVWGGGPILHQRMKDMGWLRTYRSSQLPSLIREYAASAAFAPVTGLEELVIIYNTELITDGQAPTGWADLPSERLRGQIALPDGARLSSWLLGTSALVKEHDWAYFEALRKTGVRVAPGYAEVADMVAGGQAQVGISRLEDALALIAAGMPLRIVWPDTGTVAIPKQISIVQKNDRPALMTGLAEQFVDYTLSAEGQEIARKYGLLPSRPDVSLPTAIPHDFRQLSLDNTWIAENHEELAARFIRIFGTQ